MKFDFEQIRSNLKELERGLRIFAKAESQKYEGSCADSAILAARAMADEIEKRKPSDELLGALLGLRIKDEEMIQIVINLVMEGRE